MGLGQDILLALPAAMYVPLTTGPEWEGPSQAALTSSGLCFWRQHCYKCLDQELGDLVLLQMGDLRQTTQGLQSQLFPSSNRATGTCFIHFLGS